MSKTILGIVVALVGVLKGALKWTWLPEGPEVEQAINLVLQFGGLVVAWYGRYKAKDAISPLGFKGAPPTVPPLLLALLTFGFLGGCAGDVTIHADADFDDTTIGDENSENSPPAPAVPENIP